MNQEEKDKKIEKDFEAFVNEDPARRSYLVPIFKNLKESLAARRANYITLQDQQYFAPLFQRRRTEFKTIKEKQDYQNTIHRLSLEFERKYGMGHVFKPYVFVDNEEDQNVISEIPVGSPALNRSIDFDEAKTPSMQEADDQMRKMLNAKISLPVLREKALALMWNGILKPNLEDPSVLEKLEEEKKKVELRQRIFDLYKQAEKEGKLHLVIDAFNKPPSAPNKVETSSSSVEEEMETEMIEFE